MTDHTEAPAIDGASTAIIRTSYLAWVTMMHRSAEAATANRRQAIERARAWGATWEELGEAMAMSRQAAHKRFGQDLD
jgi:hypothetical protein